MITYKKLIGEGITDSNGECSVGYVGKDEATLNIKAEAVNLTATTQIQVNYGLLLTSNKKIIQTGETATLTAKIPPKQGVIIENQTVYLSKIIDDSDLSLELTASTNIIQAGNNLTLTAKVTDSNNNIENIIVNLFKESDSMAKELVATLVTDSNGEASYNYVGVGAGKIDFSAESGILQSETYDVLDCQYIDKCTSDDHANWNSTTGFIWSDGKCTITVSSSSFLRIATSIVGDFEATFKAKNDAIRLAMYNASNSKQSRQWNMSATTDEVYYKINRVGSTWTAKTSTDGTNWTNLTERSDDTDLTTEDIYFGFIIATSTERSITYTDLKVYPI